VHEGGVEIRCLDDGAFRFVRPNGEAFESPAPPAFDGRAIVVAHESIGLGITPTTAVTRWMGDAIDLELTVETLMQRRASAEDAPAGTSAD
jgi:hypothetical protein